MKDWQCKISKDISQIEPAAWNEIAGQDDPFLEHEFLLSLEEAACVGRNTSWRPHHVLLYAGSQLIGALPFYIRYDSYGEYIFDHAWAQAYAQAGLAYYPKGLAAIPFTPVNGRRLLTHPKYDFQSVAIKLLEELFQVGKREQLSSLHFLFLSDAERVFLEEQGFLTRLSTQFHWENQGYTSFDHYLADLRSGRRKQIKKERRRLREEQSLLVRTYTGDDIQPEHLQAMYTFYNITSNRKWGQPYLNWAWFEQVHKRLRQRTLLVLAWGKDQEAVAGTLNFFKGKKLAGRYWGARGHFPYLHFELCYYRLIEYAIQNQIQMFEAGAQGEHKFLRGFAPKTCYSSHWFFLPSARRAIQNFLEAERSYVDQAVHSYNAQSPLKRLRLSDFSCENTPP